MAQDNVGRHAGATQVQIAIFEAQGLVHLVGFVADIKGRILGRVEDHHLCGQDLDTARGQICVLETLGALMHKPCHLHDELVAALGRCLVGRRGGLRIDGDLGDAKAIPQVQEDQAPVIPTPVHPAGQGDSLPHVLDAQFTASMAFQHGSYIRS